MKAQRRTKLKSGFTLAVALVFLAVLLAISFSFMGDQALAAVDYTSFEYKEVTTGDVSSYNPAWAPGDDGKIDTARKFIAYFLGAIGDTSETYTLEANFLITATNWSEKASANRALLECNGHVIWNSSNDRYVDDKGAVKQNKDATKTTVTVTGNDTVGALASENTGIVRNLKYYYDNTYYVKKSGATGSLFVGGMFGKNSGTIENCHIEIGGAVTTTSEKENITSNVGGAIGYNGGQILSTEIISTVALEAYSDEATDKDRAKNNIIYAGGVIGRHEGDMLECGVKTTGSTIAADNINQWTGETGSTISGFFGQYKDKIPFGIGDAAQGLVDKIAGSEYNDAPAVHPAGMMIGALGGGGKIRSCTLDVNGAAISYGLQGSSNDGTISGGLIGLLMDTCTTAGKVINNTIRLNSSQSAFVIPSLDLADAAIEAVSAWLSVGRSTGESGKLKVYLGAFVGRSAASSSSLSISNNYIRIAGYNDMIESGADTSKEAFYNAQMGLICGSSITVGTNNWLVRKLAECGTTKLVENGTSTGAMNFLCIYGDGDVEKVEKVQGDGASGFTVKEKPICSPFYGWTPDMISPNFDRVNKTHELNNSSSSGKTEYAVFIDAKIESSGELTQFAKDVNLIKNESWKNKNVTLSWLETKLAKDILVETGTPVIEDFYGTFDGSYVDEEGNIKCHTISFAAGSSITHDYQPDETPKEMNTGLFGTIHSGATVKNVNIVFGGSINEAGGLEFDVSEDDQKALTNLKHYDQGKKDDEGVYPNTNTVRSRTYATTAADAPRPEDMELSLSECYCYFFTGTSYKTDADLNPGYVEVLPYKCKVVIETHNVGVLCGKNEGTITNVTVDAEKSSYIASTAKDVTIGVLCGRNASTGVINKSSSSLRGKVIAKARENGTFGGIIGVDDSGAAAAKLSSFVGGSVEVLMAEDYHVVRYYKYARALASTSDPGEDSEYTVIAYDYTDGDAEDKKTYYFYVQKLMGTDTRKIYGNDTDTQDKLKSVIGALIGLYQGGTGSITDSVASSGDTGSFNSTVFYTDAKSSNVQIGALIGSVKEGSSLTYANCWAAMSKTQYDKADLEKLHAVGSTVGQVGGINLVYVSKEAIVVPLMDRSESAALPIGFTLEAREGMTFSGWYDYTNGAENSEVVTAGLVGSVYTPQNQAKNGSTLVYIAELINLRIFNKSELEKISRTTNEGRGYEGVEFVLGADLIPDSNFIPIGTETYPFLGTFNGNGLTITISNALASGKLAGLFGCVGEQGTIKNLNVKLSVNIGNGETFAAGAVAAINYGTIGSDSSKGKVIVEVNKQISAHSAGGIVGINYGTVKNTEVTLTYDGAFDHGTVTAATPAPNGPNSGVKGPFYAGGAVGHSLKVAEDKDAIVKNVIVRFERPTDIDESGAIHSSANKYALGGVIGKNDVGAKAYSLVSVVKDGTIINHKMGGGGTDRYQGLIIGENASEDTDGLWTLYLSQAEDGSPVYGDPVAVYDGNGSSDGKVVLLNGAQNATTGNILIQYGYGSVDVQIVGGASDQGGEIIFLSSKIEGTDAVDFYDYIADFHTGERVSVSEGNTGYSFSPTVGNAKRQGLTGKVYYAGFCNHSIYSQETYNAVAANTAKGYKLYVEYNVTKSFTLDAAETPRSIGTAAHPFYGAILGNDNTVSLKRSAISYPAFVGVIGDETHKASIVKNLRLIVQPQAKSLASEGCEARGFLTDVNYGTISAVTVTVRARLQNASGAAGAVAGINNGDITSATVVVEYANLEAEGFGVIEGKYVGAIAGINKGSIGGAANAIDVTIKKSGDNGGGVLYGTDSVGAVIGKNEGDLLSAVVKVYGSIVGQYASALVGHNEGRIKAAIVSVYAGATYVGTEAFGVIAGINKGNISGSQDSSYDIKAYLYEAPTYGASLSFTVKERVIEAEAEVVKGNVVDTGAAVTKVMGGAVGINTDTVKNVFFESTASLIASDVAGGLVGDNTGLLDSSSLNLKASGNVFASTAGGVVGTNAGKMRRILATLRGTLGSESADDKKGIVAAVKAGGFAGENTVKVDENKTKGIHDSAVTLYGNIYGTKAGLGVGSTTQDACADYAWIQVCNSSTLPMQGEVVGATDDKKTAGFNVIRVLNDTLLDVKQEADSTLHFSSTVPGVKNWYTDIAAWDVTENAILSEGLSASKILFKPELSNDAFCDHVYYVCYDKLLISNSSDLNTVAMLVNSHDYYRGVLFKLEKDIAVDNSTVLRPIGTEEHPFSGYFKGDMHTITIKAKCVISGLKHSGLFGYTAEGSSIEDFLLVIESAVIIGSVNTEEIGAVVGHNNSAMKNVFVNLSSSLTYRTNGIAGAFIGVQEEKGVSYENCWISVLNEPNIPVVGNGEKIGVNYIGVIGHGGMAMSLVSAANAEVQYKALDSALSRYYGWYVGEEKLDFGADYSVAEELTLSKQDLGAFVYGHGVGENGSAKGTATKIVFTTENGETVKNNRITLSFINLNIASEEEFRTFASEMNTYGAQENAEFTLEKDITLGEFDSVGTADIPFTGTFNGQGHTITLSQAVEKREYAGLFGYVGVGGIVKNLIVDVANGVKIGDKDALYSGAAVALLFGTLQDVVVIAEENTSVYTTQGDAASGGIVGRAGKVVDGGSQDITYTIKNAWLIIAEGTEMQSPVGQDPYYENHQTTCGVGRTMRIVGEKSPIIKIADDPVTKDVVDYKISFNTLDITPFYGYIDNAASNEVQMKPISNNYSNLAQWTVSSSTDDTVVRYTYTYVENNETKTETRVAPVDMLCVFIDKDIDSEAEFMQIAIDVAKGRSYPGITYELTKDLDFKKYQTLTPIGGEVSTGNGYFIERDFVGGFDGKGHTISLPDTLTVTGRYAGLFGRVGADARIKNLTVKADCTIGDVETGLNTEHTIYAGVLAAYASGGTYDSVVVVMGRYASLHATFATGRMFGYLPNTAGNVADNSWVLCYNSKANNEMNAAELAFNAEFAKPSGADLEQGANQGGVNTLMIVAAGDITVSRPQSNSKDYRPLQFSGIKNATWHLLNASTGDASGSLVGDVEEDAYLPSTAVHRLGFNVSYLKESIATLADLLSFAENVNNGYDFYKLTFSLSQDILISKEAILALKKAQFPSIGNALSGMNGTLDGKNHSITIGAHVEITGEYAGLFGRIGEDGTVKNLRIKAGGILGDNGAKYVGAIAYNGGTIENVVVVSDHVALKTGAGGYSGLAIGYDETNLVSNVWALVDASSYVDTIGKCAAGDSGVNTMKIVGVGEVDASLVTEDGKTKVKFTATTVKVSGWYKSFKDSVQISSAMLSDGTLKSGGINADGYMIAATNLFGVKYEVAVYKEKIESELDFLAIAEDVNVGGYSFKHVTFTLAKDLIIPTVSSEIGYLSIGDAKHPFEGTLDGAYHSITIKKDSIIDGIFGNNAGTIRNLVVIVNGTVGSSEENLIKSYVGALAVTNSGTIESVYVKIAGTGLITGYVAGGIAGINTGVIKNSIVEVYGTIKAEAKDSRTISAGAVAGINRGRIEGSSEEEYGIWRKKGLLPETVVETRSAPGTASYAVEANVFLGKAASICAIATGKDAAEAFADAGGAVGTHEQNGMIEYLIVYSCPGSEVEASTEGQGARAGGMVGYASAGINHSVIFLYGQVTSTALKGGTAGYLDGVTAINAWQVTANDETVNAAGDGAKTINRLDIKGNGILMATIDTQMKTVLFTDITTDIDEKGAAIDGWYNINTLLVDDTLGNADKDESGRQTFLPVVGIQNKYVKVIFVNTEIATVKDLESMAQSVAGGLSGASTVFTLKNDIVIDKDHVLSSLIGTKAYPFKNTFDGNGKKIILKDGILPGEEYMGLFGYTESGSVIKNLTIDVQAGRYGSADSKYTAILAAYHYGTIKGVDVTVQKGAEILGQTVGTIAAISFGTISDIDLILAGKVTADGDDNTLIAGGIVGSNDGLITDVRVNKTDSALDAASIEIGTQKAFTTYVGVISGENYNEISAVEVYFGGTLKAQGMQTSYVALGVGINLGTIDRIYVEAGSVTFGSGISAGLVGSNMNTVKNSLVKVVGVDFGATDSVIGDNVKANDPNKVFNVWVYTDPDHMAYISKAPCVNSITYDAGRTLSCPDAAAVKEGKIAFSSEIVAGGNRIDLFANIVDGKYDVGTGAAMKNLSYSDGKVRYLAYASAVSGVRICLTARNVISSGSELYAFAVAVNSGVYPFAASTFTLGADFALPEGDFPGIKLPANLILDGSHHVVTVGEAVISDGLFDTNNGAIKNIGLKLTKAETNALVKSNSGAVSNAVVYLEEGASVAEGKYFADGGTVTDAWLVVREATELGKGAIPYAILRINGKGDLKQGEDVNHKMTFTAAPSENMIFIGYTVEEKLDEVYSVTFSTFGKAAKIYTAEFLSTYIDDADKLGVLDRVVSLGYQGKDEIFTIGADLTVTSSLFSQKFIGTIIGAVDEEGNGRKIVATESVDGSVFGQFAGTMRDLVIDVTALAKKDTSLFGGTAEVALVRVVIEEDRKALQIGAPVGSDPIWIVSKNDKLYNAFLTSSIEEDEKYDENYSLLYRNGPVSYTFGETNIIVNAADSESQVFAGYFGTKGDGVKDKTILEPSLALEAAAGKVYLLNYINRTFSQEDDLVRLGRAVKVGLTFEGIDFRISGSGFTVMNEISAIDDATHPFKGNIKGGLHSEIVYAMGVTVSPILHTLYGELSDIIFTYRKKTKFVGAATLVVKNEGKMSAIVVNSENADLFKDSAALTLDNEQGETVNCWFVTSGDAKAAPDGNLKGVNRILRNDAIGISSIVFEKDTQGTQVSFRFSADVGNYLCIYNAAGTLPGDYYTSTQSYSAPVKSSGEDISVQGKTAVSVESDLRYLGYATQYGNMAEDTTITLANDLTLEGRIPTVKWDRMILDLCGHSLTLKTPSGSDVLFSIVTEGGTLKNGVINLYPGCYMIGSEGLVLDNVTLFLRDDTTGEMAIPAYVIKDVTVVTEQANDYKTKLSVKAAEGYDMTYNFLYAPNKAAIIATYAYDDKEKTYTATLIGAHNDDYWFGAIQPIADESYAGKQSVAYFSPKVLKSAEDYTAFALAAKNNEKYLENTTVSLANDLTLDGATVPAVRYAGSFLGNGHTITVENGEYGAPYVTFDSGATALAFAFTNVTFESDTKSKLISAPAGSTIAVVIYHRTGTDKQEETDALAVNVYGAEGTLRVTFDEATGLFRFDAEETETYALKEWKQGDSVVNNDGAYARSFYSGKDPVSAHFALCYRVKLAYEIVDIGGNDRTAELLEKNAAVLPRFDGVRVYFEEDLKQADSEELKDVSVKISYIGEGFLFVSLLGDGKAEVTQNTDIHDFSVKLKRGEYGIATLTAKILYLEMPWMHATYSAENKSVDLSAYETYAKTTLGYDTVQISYTAIGDTPEPVNDLPYHAGSYLLTFRVLKSVTIDETTVTKEMGVAYGGIVIDKAILRVDAVSIKNKVYDGTAIAEYDPETLSVTGYLDEQDKTYIDLSGLTFIFENANAGEGKAIYIGADAVLGYKRPQGVSTHDKKYYYVYLDYALEADALREIRASIEPKKLQLEVSSMTVRYLDQFDFANGGVPKTIKFSPKTKDKDAFATEADQVAFEALSTSLITRESANRYDAGYYRMVVSNRFALPNYEITLTGTEAYYIVLPTVVTVTFDKKDGVYGDKITAPSYTISATSEDKRTTYTKLRDGDALYFESVTYNDGASLLPNTDETRYAFTCLFSAKNKNYTVLSPDYEIVNGVALPRLSANGILMITKRTIIVTAKDSENTKRIGSKLAASTERYSVSLTGGTSLAESSHSLVAVREEGEAVGKYEFSFSVVDKDGNDVSDRYILTTANGGKYYYEITKVTLVVKPNKTTRVYGEVIGAINYGVSVEKGGISLSDLYRAMFGEVKDKIALADFGVTVSFGYNDADILDVGFYKASFEYAFINGDTEEAKTLYRIATSSIADVVCPSADLLSVIEVQKRRITITIGDIKKVYDGTATYPEKDIKYTVSLSYDEKTGATLGTKEGFLNGDYDARGTKYVKLVQKGAYELQGLSSSVGVYKINGAFELQAGAAGDKSDNYYIALVSGSFAIEQAKVTISAEMGYFDEETGAFTRAFITRSGMNIMDTIYYGDSRAELCFYVDKGGEYLNIPEEGTDKEISDYIVKVLGLRYNKLSKIAPFEDNPTSDDGPTTVDILGIYSTNNNIRVSCYDTRNAALVTANIARVSLKIRVLSGTKIVGEADPAISYEILAYDPENNNSLIENYDEIAKGTFSVIISAVRSNGESLGVYAYDTDSIFVDIVNLQSGESLFDTTSATGKAFAAENDIVAEVPETLTLKIKQDSFLKSDVGKYLIYGGAILLIAVGVVLLLVLVPRARKKKLAKMAAESAVLPTDPTDDDPTDPTEGDPTDGAEAEDGAGEVDEEGVPDEDAPAEEPEDPAEDTLAEGEESPAEEGSTEKDVATEEPSAVETEKDEIELPNDIEEVPAEIEIPTDGEEVPAESADASSDNAETPSVETDVEGKEPEKDFSELDFDITGEGSDKE